MLPYSPLHHLLMKACPFPLIATSGNRSDEPIAIANEEAMTRLKDIADHFLLNDLPIVRVCDDSVVRLTRGRAGILRRARGTELPSPLGRNVFLSQCAAASLPEYRFHSRRRFGDGDAANGSHIDATGRREGQGEAGNRRH